MPPRLHLNEHVSPRLAVQLRQYGFDVTSTVERDLIAVDDDVQLAFAVSEHRAIVTMNCSDFVALHQQYLAAGQKHWGIVLSTEEPIEILRRRLLRLLHTLSEEELKNQVC